MPEGTVPEMVLVIELSAPVDSFKGALKRAGLEWLDEIEADDTEPDDDFFIVDRHGERSDKTYSSRVYLTMSNQEALAQLQSLWQRWRDNPEEEWRWGEGAWKQVFPKIKSIRPWSAEDRLRDTGLETAWRKRLDAGDDSVRFEAELWYRRSANRRQRAETMLRKLVDDVGGEVLKSAEIPEIQYHALLGCVPASAAAQIIAHDDVQLLQADDVMFLRPTGQVSYPGPVAEMPVEVAPSMARSAPSDAPPIVAVLDGLPFENHELLDDRIIIDDPEGWTTEIPANRRFHGTAITSLIIHGDLGDGEPPLGRRIYVRPVLKPHPWPENIGEHIPEDELPVDLVHRAVRRLFDSAEGAACPSACIINLSLGDASRIFNSWLSPWAKLVDWLAWRYQVLFIVSAGNHADSLQLDIPGGNIGTLSPDDLQAAVLRALVNSTRNRRLLAPAESINSVTAGALHRDATTAPLQATFHLDPLANNVLPSPISAHGLGYRRAIKPEILLPGGRQIYQVPPVPQGPNAVIEPLASPFAKPGQTVAAPSAALGELHRRVQCRGTSNAAALATRTAAELYEVVETIQGEPGGDILNGIAMAVVVKALLVHGADWGEAGGIFDALLRPQVSGSKIREHVSRFLGYGAIKPGYAATCTDQRVTVLGCGALENDQAHVFSLPLPPSLSGEAALRKLTITLAWMSPLAFGTQKYRCAHLWFDPAGYREVVPDRAFYDHRAVSRGTVQHEVFSGEKAAIFQDGDLIGINVNCREDAASLQDSVAYGLAVTFEVEEGVAIPVYEEVRSRIRARVEVQPAV